MSILVLTSDTLIGTPATGNLEYNGQFFGTDSNASRAQMQRITQGSAVTCAGQTSIDFASLPAWAKRITVMFNGVSTSGTSPLRFRLGGSSVETSGYTGMALRAVSGGTVGTGTFTLGFDSAGSSVAASTYTGHVIFTNVSGNIWVMSGMFGVSDASTMNNISGTKTLADTLTTVRITTVNGTDTFDTTPSAGSINILYEG
jgi:hypothetical protein